MTKTNGAHQHVWFALADAEACRLLYCTLTTQGTHHVDEYDALQNNLPHQEQARPMTNAGTKHNVEEGERRFASEIVSWLQARAGQYEISHLVILAPPRMLGVIRSVPLGSLKGRVDELKGDLMRLQVGQLADHPMVRELMSQQQHLQTTASGGSLSKDIHG